MRGTTNQPLMTFTKIRTTTQTPVDLIGIVEGFVVTHLSPSNKWVTDTDIVSQLLEGYTKWTIRTGEDRNNPGLLFSFLTTNFKDYLTRTIRRETRQEEFKEPGDLGVSSYTRQSTRDPLSTTISEETTQEILDLLSDRQQSVLLSLVDGYTHQEISEMEGVSRPMVSKIVKQIRTKLTK
jgi:RNA polymerase sigma factor (sigma-70 family)